MNTKLFWSLLIITSLVAAFVSMEAGDVPGANLFIAVAALQGAAAWWCLSPDKESGKWVVIVRAAKPGEFGGFVSMKAVRGGDEWRVVEADCAANAVCNVLGAGEVPVMWKKWEELSVLRRLQLTVRDFVRGFF